MENLQCPVCDASTLTSVLVGRVSMLQCNACHVTVTPRHLLRINEHRYYEDSYVMTPSSRASARQWHYSQYPEFIQLLSEIGTYSAPPGRWLDVGCGTGAFLDECRHTGYEVTGVEPSRVSADEAMRVGIRVHHSIESIDEDYDVVSMWHVVEHLPDPKTTLQSLRTLIRPGGVLCLRVPNFMGKWSRILRDRWVWFQPQHHTVHFGVDSLRQLLHNSGYTVLMIRCQRPNRTLVRKAYSLASAVFNTYAQTPRESMYRSFLRLLKDLTAEEIFVVAKPRI